MIQKVRKQPKREKKSKYSSLLNFVFERFLDFFEEKLESFQKMNSLDLMKTQKEIFEFNNCVNLDLVEKSRVVNKQIEEIEIYKEELERNKMKYISFINASSFKSLIDLQNKGSEYSQKSIIIISNFSFFFF